jgi:hypothetical protein
MNDEMSAKVQIASTHTSLRDAARAVLLRARSLSIRTLTIEPDTNPEVGQDNQNMQINDIAEVIDLVIGMLQEAQELIEKHTEWLSSLRNKID